MSAELSMPWSVILHHFDPDILEGYLARHVDGFSKLDGFEKFSDGQSNPTYKLKSAGNTFVLRAKPPGKLLKSAHAVDREFRVMQALAATDVPVPQVFHLTEETSPIGPQFLVMSWVDGCIFWDPALPDQDRHIRARVYDQMNHVLATLHSVAPAEVGLHDFGKPGNYFERQLNRWAGQYAASVDKPHPDALWLIDWLRERIVPDDGSVSIVHGDYRIDNMIFDRQSHEVKALLDWELSTLGHPLADLAYQCMHWRLPHRGDFRGLAGVDRKALGIPDENEYVALYCQRRGIAQPENWPFYIVFCYFRLLAILQGVLRRAVDGNASNPKDQSQILDIIDLMVRDARTYAKRHP
jgi:aminoglycoside phosphotransferase (APT) family kinase protein